MCRRLILVAIAFLAAPAIARAQSFEAGAHVAVSRWSEFEGADVGIGGRFTWKPTTLLGVEADLTWYPAEFPPDSVAFSGQRIEGLFGVTVSTTSSSFLRADVADRILEYPGPSFARNFELVDDAFYGHALRFTFGGGVRF